MFLWRCSFGGALVNNLELFESVLDSAEEVLNFNESVKKFLVGLATRSNQVLVEIVL